MRTKQGAAVLDLKALAEDGTFSGYGSIFGNRDSYGDVVMPGAFAKSLAEHRRRGSKPKMFWQHDPREPIGSWVDLSEDGKGLWVEGRLNMEVQRGRETHALLKAGDIDGLSIGYFTVTAEDDEAKGVTKLREVRLVEVSVVSLGANDRALVDTVKADDTRLTKIYEIVEAGGMPTERQFGKAMQALGFTNAKAEALATACKPILVGEPEAKADDPAAYFAALRDTLA